MRRGMFCHVNAPRLLDRTTQTELPRRGCAACAGGALVVVPRHRRRANRGADETTRTQRTRRHDNRRGKRRSWVVCGAPRLSNRSTPTEVSARRILWRVRVLLSSSRRVVVIEPIEESRRDDASTAGGDKTTKDAQLGGALRPSNRTAPPSRHGRAARVGDTLVIELRFGRQVHQRQERERRRDCNGRDHKRPNKARAVWRSVMASLSGRRKTSAWFVICCSDRCSCLVSGDEEWSGRRVAPTGACSSTTSLRCLCLKRVVGGRRRSCP